MSDNPSEAQRTRGNLPALRSRHKAPSAGSRDLFCNRLFKMLNILAREVGADTPDEFCFAQEPIRFGDCPLGVDPLWLDSIQPRALDRQLADQDSHAPLPLGPPVMGANPRADFLADVPTGVVPHQQQHLLAVGLQQCADPSEEGGRHRAHGTTVNEANQYLLRVSSKDPVTGDDLRVCVLFREGHLPQSNRLVLGPRVQLGLRQTRPPDFIGEAQYPFRMGRCQANQPVALLFFNAYRGSGLVIQCLARFHATPIRLKACRIDSLLKAREVTPCSKQTSASRRSVHRRVGLPNERGLSCTIARSRSRLVSSSTGATLLGRDDLARKQVACRLCTHESCCAR